MGCAAYHDRDAPCDFCPTRTALETGDSVVGVVPYETGAGTEGSQELLSSPLFDDRSTVVGVIKYVRDISRLEEEERGAYTRCSAMATTSFRRLTSTRRREEGKLRSKRT